MLSLFSKFTSGSPEIRMLHPPGEEGFRFRVNQQSYISKNPLWVKYQRDAASGSSEASGTLRDEKAAGKAIHSVGPWLPLRANQNDLPFKLRKRGRKILRSPDRKKGLADVLREGGRVKSFRLRDAIVYSYSRDMRFVQLLCLIFLFSVWWYIAPFEVLSNPGVLSSPDIGEVVRVARDTFESNVCSSHQVPSPCGCGEPINKAARHLLEPKELFILAPISLT